MNRSLFKIILCLGFFSPVLFLLIHPKNSFSTPSTNFKDQLSSAQLSYSDTLTASNAAGNSIAYVTTNNYNLDIGDTLTIGTGTYIVTGLIGTDGISLNTPLASGDADSGDTVLSARKATHTISFEPQSSVTQGKWQILIKAASSNNNDGTADSTGFDAYGLLDTDITCPWGATASVGTTIVSTNTYHAITCALGAGITNPVGTGDTGTVIIGSSNLLINPAPASGHTTGQANADADTYSVILRHLESDDTVIDEDTTTGKIAVTESIRVTATVDPTITFSVGNSGVTTPGTTLCGTAINSGASNTTGATVNFGSLSLGQANNLAQFIQCTTNAANGYVIQVFESAPLTMIGTTTTIPDTTCPSNTCSTSVAADWTTLTESGFGYSLDVGSTSAGAILGITTSGYYKAFGIGYAQAQSILSRTDTPANTDSAYICYRTTVSTQQPAGTYQNEINFIATATF